MNKKLLGFTFLFLLFSMNLSIFCIDIIKYTRNKDSKHKRIYLYGKQVCKIALGIVVAWYAKDQVYYIHWLTPEKITNLYIDIGFNKFETKTGLEWVDGLTAMRDSMKATSVISFVAAVGLIGSGIEGIYKEIYQKK